MRRPDGTEVAYHLALPTALAVGAVPTETAPLGRLVLAACAVLSGPGYWLAVWRLSRARKPVEAASEAREQVAA